MEKIPKRLFAKAKKLMAFPVGKSQADLILV
jgi:hypothetical protein